MASQAVNVNEVAALIEWLSMRVQSVHKREAALRAEPGVPSNKEWLTRVDAARAEIKKLSDLRSRVAAREYAAIDEARTMMADKEDASSRETSPHGPWVVYMASDNGAILIEAPEDAVASSEREAAQVQRILHVIGHGATADEARTDARRRLPRRVPRAGT
jgi:hypothetical protein